MTKREMFEQIQENAPHLNAIRCAINELEAAALTARDVYNCTNESEYNSDAYECEKIAAALTALYNNITRREAANMQTSTALYNNITRREAANMLTSAALYNNLTRREAANMQTSAVKKCPFEGDKPEDIWVTKRWDGE